MEIRAWRLDACLESFNCFAKQGHEEDDDGMVLDHTMACLLFLSSILVFQCFD